MGFSGGLMGFNGMCPLVIEHNELENHQAINGETWENLLFRVGHVQ